MAIAAWGNILGARETFPISSLVAATSFAAAPVGLALRANIGHSFEEIHIYIRILLSLWFYDPTTSIRIRIQGGLWNNIWDKCYANVRKKSNCPRQIRGLFKKLDTASYRSLEKQHPICCSIFRSSDRVHRRYREWELKGAKLHNATFCQKTRFTSVLERGEEGASLSSCYFANFLYRREGVQMSPIVGLLFARWGFIPRGEYVRDVCNFSKGES